MELHELIEELTRKNLIKSAVIPHDRPITRLMMVDGKEEEYDSQALYFGHMEQLKQCRMLPDNLVTEDGEIDVLPDTCANLLLVPQGCIPAAFNAAQRELDTRQEAERSYARMLRMLLNGDGLVSILNELSRRFLRPLAIMDISGKIIAHSAPFMIPDSLWTESIERGYCPLNFMQHIQKMRAQNIRTGQKNLNNTQAFFSVCETSSLAYICSRIFVKNELMGYVFLFAYDQFSDKSSYEILPMVSKAAGEYMEHYSRDTDLSTSLYRSILSDLLEHSDQALANVRITAGNLNFPTNMRLLFVKPEFHLGENYVKSRLCTEMQQIFSGVPSLYYNHGIVQVISTDGRGELSEENQKGMMQLLESQHLIAGISNLFHRPEQIPKFYMQAKDALHLARRIGKTGRLHAYKDLAFFSLISLLPTDVSPGIFCHPALEQLRKYDLEHDTELYRTLQVYAESGFSQKATAETLFLHRNTLNYRLQRIREITNIDLALPDQMFAIAYSVQIDRYLSHQYM
ncbi:MAG: helix-turn-helix domain-containing protein [Lachnospiraceae bacterium]|nr:helix-turn-helix domain-containing protein [Lachnospiraceae bacterium]